MAHVQCKVCDSGTLERRKRHRLSGPAVVIGYIFLIPSILGILLGLFLIVGGGGAASSLDEVREEQRPMLTQAGVPGGMIDRIMSGDHITQDEQQKLSAAQRQAVIEAQGRVAAMALGGIAGVGVGVFLVFGAFVGGLLGWILIMKKWVLQCVQCGAVVNAS